MLAATGDRDEAVRSIVGATDAQAAWDACERADWMLWLVGRLLGGAPEGAERKRLVLCASECAETSLPFVRDEKAGATVRACIQTTQAWALDEATIEELREARKQALRVWSYSADADADDAAAAAADVCGRPRLACWSPR